jgi:hypothetical protein
MLWDWERPNDPRVPEALHFAVRVTRCGCTDDETSQWSNKAFQLLHRRYAKSEWAARRNITTERVSLSFRVWSSKGREL